MHGIQGRLEWVYYGCPRTPAITTVDRNLESVGRAAMIYATGSWFASWFRDDW